MNRSERLTETLCPDLSLTGPSVLSNTYNITNRNKHCFSAADCLDRPLDKFGDKTSQSAVGTTEARERRICLCLCLSDPNRSFISALLWKGTPGPEILTHRRSCFPPLLGQAYDSSCLQRGAYLTGGNTITSRCVRYNVNAYLSCCDLKSVDLFYI